MASTDPVSRLDFVRRGKRLEYFTIAYNSLEGLLSVASGVIAGSVSLVGFGLDSIVEVTSGATLVWRLHHDVDASRREQRDRRAISIVGVCFLALAVYITYDSLSCILRHEAPERSMLGIAIAATSVVVMPMLARAKRKVAAALGSAAMNADARQTDFCTYLSAILLVGLVLNAAVGWWWADPAAALFMVPIIAKEGIDGLRGKSCGCESSACH